jgi:hypothetical protein
MGTGDSLLCLAAGSCSHVHFQGAFPARYTWAISLSCYFLMFRCPVLYVEIIKSISDSILFSNAHQVFSLWIFFPQFLLNLGAHVPGAYLFVLLL